MQEKSIKNVNLNQAFLEVKEYVKDKYFLEPEDFIEVAKIYFKHGVKTIPTSKLLVPLVSGWREIEDWDDEVFERFWYRVDKKNVGGIAILTGRANGITMIDIDDPEIFKFATGYEAETLASQTLSQKTKRGEGYHLIYIYDDELPQTQQKSFGFDIRNDGGLMFAFPSYIYDVDGTKKEYKIYNLQEIAEIQSELKDKLLKLINLRSNNKGNNYKIEAEINKENIVKVAELLGELRKNGLINGYEDIDTSFFAGLVDAGYSDEEILYLAQKIYKDEYSEKLTRYMIARAKKLDKKRSLGSLIYNLKGLNDERASEIISLLIKQKTKEDIFFEELAFKPVIPEEYTIEDGFLKTVKGELLCPAFVPIQKKLNHDGKVISLKLKFINKKEIELNAERLDKRVIRKVFTVWGITVTEEAGKKIHDYISKYEMINEEYIEHKVIVDQVGWINDRYYLPQLADNVDFAEDIRGYEAKGDKDKEFQLMKRILGAGDRLAIGYLLGFSSILVYLLQAPNFVAYFQGFTGEGKSTSARVGLSLFGKYDELQRNLNFTDVGLEIFLDKQKDVLILLDELNTVRGDTSRQIARLIYDFENGQGRTRANIDLSERKRYTFRGVLSITSEDSLINILEKSEKIVKGSTRRVLLVDMVELQEHKKIEASEVYEVIEKNYGNLIGEYIEYVVNNLNRIKEIYYMWQEELKNIDKGYGFNGQQRYIALLFTANQVAGELFNIDVEETFNLLWKLADINDMFFKSQTEMSKEYFIDKINRFISINTDCFEFYQKIEHTGKEPRVEKDIRPVKRRIYGRIETVIVKAIDAEIVEERIYLTPEGFTEFSKWIGVDEKVIKRQLVKHNIAEPAEDRIIKQTTKIINNKKFKTYILSL